MNWSPLCCDRGCSTVTLTRLFVDIDSFDQHFQPGKMQPKAAGKTPGCTSSPLLEILEGIPCGLWDMLLSIKGDTTSTNRRVDQLVEQEDVIEDTPVSGADTELANKVDELSTIITLLTAKLEKCETKCNLLSDQVDQLRAQSMKTNLIFNFDRDVDQYKEAKGENCVELVRPFLGSVMGIDNANSLYIPVAYRIGCPDPNYTRAILANSQLQATLTVL